MKAFAILSAALIAAAVPGTANAQRSETVFECALTNGTTVRVTQQGQRLTYRYGTPRRAELTLSGTPTSRNVFHLAERYYSILHQLRFQNGRHSYVVYSLPGSTTADARGSFGVAVLRDGRRVSDTQCRRSTEFQAGFDLMQSLPQDEDRYNIMALD